MPQFSLKHAKKPWKQDMFPVNGAIRSEKRYVIWSPGKGDGFLLLYKRLEAGSYSIVETAKANHLNPFWYFTHLLTVLPELRRKYGTIDAAPVAELDRLLPWSKELPDNCHSKRR